MINVWISNVALIKFFSTADQLKSHKKVFTRWINLQLSKVRVKY